MRQRFCSGRSGIRLVGPMPPRQKKTTNVTRVPTNRRFWCRRQNSPGSNRRQTSRFATGGTCAHRAARRLARITILRKCASTIPSARGSSEPCRRDHDTTSATVGCPAGRGCRGGSRRDRSLTTDVRRLGWERADERQRSRRAAPLATRPSRFVGVSGGSRPQRGGRRVAIARGRDSTPFAHAILKHANSCRLRSGST
jgi:hypothetical protein